MVLEVKRKRKGSNQRKLRVRTCGGILLYVPLLVASKVHAAMEEIYQVIDRILNKQIYTFRRRYMRPGISF